MPGIFKASTARILVTGSRECNDSDYEQIYTEIKHVAGENPPPGSITVVTGGARGADQLAERAARALGFKVESYPVSSADWAGPCRAECKPGHRRVGRYGKDYCPAVGNYRNARMVRLGADLCLAFFKRGAANSGTTDCAGKAELAGIATWRIPV